MLTGLTVSGIDANKRADMFPTNIKANWIQKIHEVLFVCLRLAYRLQTGTKVERMRVLGRKYWGKGNWEARRKQHSPIVWSRATFCGELDKWWMKDVSDFYAFADLWLAEPRTPFLKQILGTSNRRDSWLENEVSWNLSWDIEGVV